MNRWAVVAVVVVASAAFAGPKFAVHPLDARALSADEREWLKAFTEVRLARTPGIRLAGSARLEDAVRSAKGRDCESNDACLVYLANATDSLYGVFASIRRDPAAGDLIMAARVVRADGTLVRTTVRQAPPRANTATLTRAKQLVADTFDALDLKSLPDAPPVENGLERLPSPPMVPVETLTKAPPAPMSSPRQKLGLLIGAVGLATLTTGGAVLFSSVENHSRLTPDDDGAVPASQERLKREADAQGEAAVVLIPTGALLALTGTLVAFWPDSAPVKVSATPLAAGGAVAFSGVLP